MPAAAVIPAPIAYIKVVAVKKLVVEFLGCSCGAAKPCSQCSSHPRREASAIHLVLVELRLLL